MIGEYLAQGTADGVENLAQDVFWHREAQGAFGEKVAVNRGDLFAEEEAFVRNSAHPRLEGDARWPQSARGEYRNDDEIITVTVSDVL